MAGAKNIDAKILFLGQQNGHKDILVAASPGKT
jgi:hypothetical protein